MVHIKKSLEKKNVMAQNLRGVSRPEDLVFRATILSTVNWQLPFTSARIKLQVLLQLLTLSTLQRIQGGDQEGGSLSLEKLAGQDF